MTGAEWLAEVFDPALREERIRATNVVAELSGALRALEACGLLEAEQTADAQRRLRAANQEALRRPEPDVRPPGSVTESPTNLLRHVLAPLTPLVDFNGVTLVLASVELWTRSVRLRIAGLNNVTSDRLDDEHRRALHRWAEKARDAHAEGRLPDVPPTDAGARMLDMRLTLTDDLGTRYRSSGSMAGGSGHEWRFEGAFEPGMPATARELAVAVSEADGSPVHEVRVPVA